MTRKSRLLLLFMVTTMVGVGWPSDAAAQRRAPPGRTVGVAVPRSYPGRYYRPYYRPYYSPRYYYPYAYPRYYYSPWYYPYYSSFSFGFGIGFGYGWPAPYWGGYPYYGYGYPAYGYDNTASARLLISPRNAKVYADGQFVGVVDDFDGSLERLRVPIGEHEIQVYLEGYRTYSQKVLFTRGTTVKIAHTMQPLSPGDPPDPKPDAGAPTRPPDRYQRPEDAPPPRAGQQAGFGTLAIRVNPADAEILIDGEVWERPAGESRLSLDLAEGPHQVEIRKAGYRPYARTIDVLGGRTFTLNVSLPPGGPGLVQINSRR